MSWYRQSHARLALYTIRLLAVSLTLLSPLALMYGRITFSDGGWAIVLLGSAVGMAVMTFAVIAWRRSLWREKDGRLLRREGILNHIEKGISAQRMTSVQLKYTPFTILMKSCWIKISTADSALSGRDKGGITLLLHRENAARLMARLMPASDDGRESRPSALSVIISSAAGSNFFSGLLLTVPLIYRFGKYVDATLPSRIAADISNYAAGRLDVPPIMALAALLPLIGWVAHFIHNCVISGGMRLTRREDVISLSRGLISRRIVSFRKDAVSAVDIRQTALMSALGRFSCTLVTQSGDYMIFPAETERNTRLALSSMYSHCAQAVTVSPRQSDRYKYWLWWMIWAGAVAVLWLRISRSTEMWRGTVSLVCGTAIIILLWRATVGALCSKNARISVYGDCAEIVGIRSMTVHELRIFRGRIDDAQIIQSPFQRRSGLCDILLRPSGSRIAIRCRHLPETRARALLEKLI